MTVPLTTPPVAPPPPPPPPPPAPPVQPPAPPVPPAAAPLPAVAPVPRDPRRTGGWLVAAIATLLAIAAAVGLVGFAVRPRVVSAGWVAPVEERAAQPAADAPDREWADWAHDAVEEELALQGAALVAGDEQGFLAPVDPGDADLLANHLRRFRVLHEMGVGAWQQEITGPVSSIGDREWRAAIRVDYCFGTAECAAASSVVDSEWALRDNRLVLTSLGDTPRAQNGPRPWEVSDLVVRSGQRVVVAGLQAQEWRLDEAVAAGDQAAAVADTFAREGHTPSRYVIFMAGSEEWDQWYGAGLPLWSAGVTIGGTANEVMINVKVVPQSALLFILTHELTHVSTLEGRGVGTERTWWLEEGIAEYAAMLGQPVADYDALSITASYVNSSAWDGDPAVQPPGYNTDADAVSARYGIAFLAVRRIAENYGQEKLLQFFRWVVRDGRTLENAAQAAFGTSWAIVQGDCADFIYSAT